MPAARIGAILTSYLAWGGCISFYKGFIVVSPPVLPVADPLILASHVDGGVVVARRRTTTRTALHRALEQLRRNGSNLVGIILSEVTMRNKGYPCSPYYSYRAQDTKEKPAYLFRDRNLTQILCAMIGRGSNTDVTSGAIRMSMARIAGVSSCS